MTNKVYLVRYYMDYSTYGVQAIFKNKEDAVRCAEIMTKEADIDCQFYVREELIYGSLGEWEVTE